jgi:hypothetical protein
MSLPSGFEPMLHINNAAILLKRNYQKIRETRHLHQIWGICFPTLK